MSVVVIATTGLFEFITEIYHMSSAGIPADETNAKHRKYTYIKIEYLIYINYNT